MSDNWRYLGQFQAIEEGNWRARYAISFSMPAEERVLITEPYTLTMDGWLIC